MRSKRSVCKDGESSRPRWQASRGANEVSNRRMCHNGCGDQMDALQKANKVLFFGLLLHLVSRKLTQRDGHLSIPTTETRGAPTSPSAIARHSCRKAIQRRGRMSAVQGSQLVAPLRLTSSRQVSAMPLGSGHDCGIGRWMLGPTAKLRGGRAPLAGDATQGGFTM